MCYQHCASLRAEQAGELYSFRLSPMKSGMSASQAWQVSGLIDLQRRRQLHAARTRGEDGEHVRAAVVHAGEGEGEGRIQP